MCGWGCAISKMSKGGTSRWSPSVAGPNCNLRPRSQKYSWTEHSASRFGTPGGLGRVRSSMSTDKRQLAAGSAQDRGLGDQRQSCLCQHLWLALSLAPRLLELYTSLICFDVFPSCFFVSAAPIATGAVFNTVLFLSSLVFLQLRLSYC